MRMAENGFVPLLPSEPYPALRGSASMRIARFALLIFLFSALAGVPFVESRAVAGILGDARVPYSADRSLVIGEQKFEGKIYSRPGSQRHEQKVGGVEWIVLLHRNETRGWLVLPALGSRVEFDFAPAVTELGAEDLLDTSLGHERIDGLVTTKYRIEHTARDGTLVDGYLWLTRDGIPMRFEGMVTLRNRERPKTIRMELSHVETGRQDPALFEVPEGMIELPASALRSLLGAAGQR
jgi:hypothetical protein